QPRAGPLRPVHPSQWLPEPTRPSARTRQSEALRGDPPWGAGRLAFTRGERYRSSRPCSRTCRSRSTQRLRRSRSGKGPIGWRETASCHHPLSIRSVCRRHGKLPRVSSYCVTRCLVIPASRASARIGLRCLLEERDQRVAFRLAGHPLQWHLGPGNDVFGSIGEQVGDGFLRPYDVGILEGIRIGIAVQRTRPAAEQIVECRACPVGAVRRQRMANGTLAGELPLTEAQVAAYLEPAREVALAGVERRRAIKGQMNDVVI